LIIRFSKTKLRGPLESTKPIKKSAKTNLSEPEKTKENASKWQNEPEESAGTIRPEVADGRAAQGKGNSEPL
jgi:hypothetical protein